ncbi:MAG: right-handed parallel beta-helix repeat-containing protein [Pseudomonadales bacterium]|nr:right-handed parallel beta-helix repeat-containing protein [Pseudomonadales bacterium]
MTSELGTFLKILIKNPPFINPVYAVGLMLVWLLTGCGGDASGGEQTVVSSGGPAPGARLFVNNVDGDDDNDGIDKPFKSLQYALDQLRPGDVLVVQNSGQPYKSDIPEQIFDDNGQPLKTVSGFRLGTSGTATKPITIEGDSTLPPIIDQEQDDFVTGSNTVLGLLLDCVSNIVVRNLTIINVNEAGITSSIEGACETNNITLEGNTIYDVYGENYVGGIRLMGVSDVLIKENDIRNIKSRPVNEPQRFLTIGHRLSNIFIEKNTFESLDSGIVINAQGLGSTTFQPEEPITNIKIHKNSFDQVKAPVNFHNRTNDSSGVNTTKTGVFRSVDISGNLFHGVEESAILVELKGSVYQSESFCFFNNNFIDNASTAIDISGVKNVEIFNNIFHPLQGLNNNILETQLSVNNSIAYSDYNLYFASAEHLRWKLGEDPPLQGIAEWRDAESAQLSTKPGINSQAAVDPLFIDPLNNDFDLSDGSPALLAGRDGVSIGYDYSLPLDFSSNCRATF